MIFNTAAGPINIVHPNQISRIIPRERIQSHPNNPYTYLENQDILPPTFSSIPTLPSFTTQTKYITNIENEEDYLLKTLVSDLNSRISIEDFPSFEDAICHMAMRFCQNYGDPTHAILFENNVMIMGEFKSSEISFKEVDKGRGTLIVYSPHKFSIFKVPTSNQYLYPANPKYNKYTQHIMLIETFKRLDLV